MVLLLYLQLKKILVLILSVILSVETGLNTLKLEFVREAMEEAGLKVMRGEGYDGLEHWVEQAISRDVAVAVRV